MKENSNLTACIHVDLWIHGELKCKLSNHKGHSATLKPYKLNLASSNSKLKHVIGSSLIGLSEYENII